MAKNLIRSTAEYNKHYTAMRGVDFSGDGDTSRFAYLENMYRDYDKDGEGVTVSIPGFRRLTTLPHPITRIYSQRTQYGTHLLVQAGCELYRFPIDARDELAPLTSIATLASTESTGFCSEGYFFLCDGERLWRIDEEGVARPIGEDEGELSPYVPTVFVNGEAYEQRNLLSKHFIETLSSITADSFSAGTHGLSYEILSEAERSCALAGVAEVTDTDIEVPARVVILGKEYHVVAVATHAFYGNTTLRSIRLPYGCREIGPYAFAGCTALGAVTLSDTLAKIGDYAFSGCRSLYKFHFGYGLAEVGREIFKGCVSLMSVDTTCINTQIPSAVLAPFDNKTLNYQIPFPAYRYELPVYSTAKSIDKLLIGEVEFPFTPCTENGYTIAVSVEIDDRTFAAGKLVRLYGTYGGAVGDPEDTEGSIVAGNEGVTDTRQMIEGCTVSELFDGRVFLSGNPKYPNTVFYSARDNTGKNNPTYFGILNYFNDGIGRCRVRDLLSVGGTLAVFKEADDGCGGIYYHTAKEAESDLLPKVYPVSYIHSGVCATGEAISFYDDALFIGTHGICALEKQSVNLEKSIGCRSHNVNARLLCEDPSEIRLCLWRGYLVVAAGDTFYLADSRQTFLHSAGSYEYEWYMLKGVGTYRGDTRVYRYQSVAPPGFAVHEAPDERTKASVYSTLYGNEVVYYTREDGTRYAVYPTEEFQGGTFYPASAVFSDGELLFFGTQVGDLCVFNNDLCGKAPPHIAAREDFSEEAYAALHRDELHPVYYNFDRHAPGYILVTKRDSCGIPHLTKDTVKHSLVIKCRAMGTRRLSCAICTDRGEYQELAHIPATLSSFEDTDFAVFGFDCGESMTLPIYEKEKGWVEKEVGLSSDEFSSPIGIHSISYRYRIKGKIKKY